MSSTPFGKITSDASRRLCWSTLTLAALAGCAGKHRVEVTDTGTPRYKHAAVVYELTGAHGALEHNRMRTVGAATEDNGSDLDAPPVVEPAWMFSRLEIEYPHPHGRDDVAQATLRLSHHRPATPEPTARLDKLGRALERWQTGRNDPPSPRVSPRDEIRTLDIPKHQLDLLLIDLADSGLFDTQRRPYGGSRIALRIDKGDVEKPWTPDPRLDDFVTRVYREGRFEGFAEPITP